MFPARLNQTRKLKRLLRLKRWPIYLLSLLEPIATMKAVILRHLLICLSKIADIFRRFY